MRCLGIGRGYHERVKAWKARSDCPILPHSPHSTRLINFCSSVSKYYFHESSFFSVKLASKPIHWKKLSDYAAYIFIFAEFIAAIELATTMRTLFAQPDAWIFRNRKMRIESKTKRLTFTDETVNVEVFVIGFEDVTRDLFPAHITLFTWKYRFDRVRIVLIAKIYYTSVLLEHQNALFWVTHKT